MIDILQSIEQVIENSKHVKIDGDRVKEFADSLYENELKPWIKESPFDDSRLDDEQKLAFLFVFNAISFSYWGNPKWLVGYRGESYDRGTWNMITALQRAIDEKKPILNPSFLADITQSELENILRGNTKIPLLTERCAILRELGASIKHSFSDFINSANEDILELVEKLVTEMPSFNDCSVYQGENVFFHKRAQLLASDINYIFGGLHNSDKLTACADYILPLVMRYDKILVYSPDLASKVNQKIPIPKDSEEEIEIRANTIFAIELIKNQLKLRYPKITSMKLNDYFWLRGSKVPEEIPYHLTRTISY